MKRMEFDRRKICYGGRRFLLMNTGILEISWGMTIEGEVRELK